MQSNFLKTEATLASFNSLGKVPSVILSLIILVIMGRNELQNFLRISAGIAPWHFFLVFSCTFLKSNLSESCPN